MTKDVSVGCLYGEGGRVDAMHLAHAHWLHPMLDWNMLRAFVLLESLYGIPCPSLDLTHQFRESGTTMTFCATQLIEQSGSIFDVCVVFAELVGLLPNAVRFRCISWYQGR